MKEGRPSCPHAMKAARELKSDPSRGGLSRDSSEVSVAKAENKASSQDFAFQVQLIFFA